MGGRSAEAIARRAAKRGNTVEQQVAIDKAHEKEAEALRATKKTAGSITKSKVTAASAKPSSSVTPTSVKTPSKAATAADSPSAANSAVSASTLSSPASATACAVTRPNTPGRRSAEAIARRAAKRGRTLEEQKAIDNKNITPSPAKRAALSPTSSAASAAGKATVAPTTMAPATTVSPAGTGKRSAEAIARRAAKRGNTVEQQIALDNKVADGAGAGGTTDEQRNEETKLKAKQRRELKRKEEKLAKERARKAKGSAEKKEKFTPTGVSHWGVAGSDADQIEKNKQLRLVYAADPESMSEGDRERAKLLLARDERKKAGKTARRASQSPHKGGASSGHGGWHSASPSTRPSTPNRLPQSAVASADPVAGTGKRSAEAIARRAAKRGNTVEQQIALDNKTA